VLPCATRAPDGSGSIASPGMPPTGPYPGPAGGAEGNPPIGPDGMPGIGPPSAAIAAGIGPGGPGIGAAIAGRPPAAAGASALPQLRQNFIPGGFSPRQVPHTTMAGNPCGGS